MCIWLLLGSIVSVSYTHLDVYKRQADPSIKVNRLDIIGYASPEGSLANNKRLSEGRAMALRDYLATRYDFARNQYHIIFGGENWEGLVNALDTIDIEYKDEILDIIEYTSLEQGRESKLMKLRGGVPYRYICLLYTSMHEGN